mgnify:CR=1 FL=1
MFCLSFFSFSPLLFVFFLKKNCNNAERSRESKRKTSVKLESLNPTWNETFAYSNMTAAELSARTLSVCVFERDLFADKVFLGEALVSLSGDLTAGVTTWHKLKAKST